MKVVPSYTVPIFSTSLVDTCGQFGGHVHRHILQSPQLVNMSIDMSTMSMEIKFDAN